MSLSLPETSFFKVRIAELVDLIEAHDKFVKTFLVPIAQAGIDDAESARADMHSTSPGPHPGIDRIEDAGLALVREKEGKAMLKLYETHRVGHQRTKEKLRVALGLDGDLTSSGKQAVETLQTNITEGCRDKARALIATFESTMGERSVREAEDSSEAFRTWSNDDLADEVAYIQSARSWAGKNP